MPAKGLRVPKVSKAAKPEKADKAVCTIYDDKTLGTVQISEDVLASIAALAATEVDGVASIGGNITHDKAARASARAIAKGVKVEIGENALAVRVIILVRYGCKIPQTTLQVQKKVKNALEEMTGLTVHDVHVSVADVAPESK